MPSPIPKPPERRQRRNKKTDPSKSRSSRTKLKVVAGGKSTATAAPAASSATPKADTAWLASTKKKWVAFWESPAAKAIAPSLDIAALDRLYTLYDERARSLSAFRRNRLVKGSQGQAVLNPLGRQLNSLNSQILALEDRLGLSPMSRLKLNISLDEGDDEPASLDELNDSLSLDDDAFDD